MTETSATIQTLALFKGAQQGRRTTVKDNRPVNLNLSSFQWPITALASMPHRISGFAIFIALPFVLWAFQESLNTQESFNHLQSLLDGVIVKLILWAILAGLIYHFVAGIKHLLMDIGVGETLEGGKRLALSTLFIAGILILAAGVWIW